MLNSFITKHNKLVLSFACLVVWGIMFSLTYMFPLTTDNFLFSKDMRPGYAAFMTGEPIISLESMTFHAAWRQSVLMYHTWCGRFFGNFLVYVSFMLPNLIRAILSAVLFIVLCFLIHMNIFGKSWRKNLSAGSIFFIFAFIWVAMPSFGSAFFWISVGGLPALVAQMLFLLPYRFAIDSPSEQKQIPYIYHILFFLFSVCVATLDYATSVAMPVTSFFACVWLYYKNCSPNRLSFFYFVGFLGVSLGAALTILAPGNACRIALTNDENVHEWLASSFGTRIIEYAINLPVALFWQGIPLFLLIVSIWYLRKYKINILKKIYFKCMLFVIPFVTTHVAYFFTAWPPPRAFATTTLQLLIASSIIAVHTIHILNKLRKKILFFKLFTSIIIAYFIISICIEEQRFVEVNKIFKHRETIFKENKGKDVVVAPLPKNLKDKYMVLGYHLNDLSLDKNFWVNRAVASYYELNSVAIKQSKIKQFNISINDINNKLCSAILTMKNNVVEIDLILKTDDEPSYSELYIYYSGIPGLIKYIPHPIDDKVLYLLSKNNDIRSYFVPIILCRSNAKLTWKKIEKNVYHATGSATLWGVDGNNTPIWMVQPGQSKYSFRLKIIK